MAQPDYAYRQTNMSNGPWNPSHRCEWTSGRLSLFCCSVHGQANASEAPSSPPRRTKAVRMIVRMYGRQGKRQ